MFLKKNIDLDVFDDVLQNAKHRENDASNYVIRSPLDMKIYLEIQRVCAEFLWMLNEKWG